MQNFEDATRVPLILHVPGVTDGGMRTNALVELVDVFPSLAEIAGIPVPPLCPEEENVNTTYYELLPKIQSAFSLGYSSLRGGTERGSFAWKSHEKVEKC